MTNRLRRLIRHIIGCPDEDSESEKTFDQVTQRAIAESEKGTAIAEMAKQALENMNLPRKTARAKHHH